MDDYPIAPSDPRVPHSREAEEATIGAVIINPNAYYEVARVVKADDFYIHRNLFIWEALESIVGSKRPIDLLVLSEELDKSGKLSEIGGPAYITSLVNQVPSSLNAESYAQIVRGLADRRRGIALANKTAAAAYNEEVEFDLGKIGLEFISSSKGLGNRSTPKDAASKTIDMLQSSRVYTTGIYDIDKLIGGLYPAELSVLAGYQGCGKSAEKLQGARRNAEAGHKVLLIDLEMTDAQTWFRMTCGDLGIDMNSARSGRINSETMGKLMSYAAELAEYYQNKLVIYNAPMTPSDILSVAMMERPDIIYIDTLKNVSGKPSNESQALWYDYVLNFLRMNIAQSIGSHVQVIHHINRSTFRENRPPTIHDLMFAGESDADAVFLLHRKAEDYTVVNDGAIRTVVPVTWITGKSRFGWTGEEDINFKLVNQRFYGMTNRTADERVVEYARDSAVGEFRRVDV